jgi:hypothetical protein
MIPQTLFSYFGNVYRYKLFTKLCTSYTKKHTYAFLNRSIVTRKVSILSHKPTYQLDCIPSALLWDSGVHFWHRMHSGSRSNYQDISSVRCTETQLPYTLLYKYPKPIFGLLSPPGRKAGFIRTICSLGDPWGNRTKGIFHHLITCCSFSPGVPLRACVGTFMHKYLRPSWEWLYPPGKELNFNRMNGSPGDPPGNHMIRIINQRIVPFIHRLAGDPTGKEAGWETNIGDTKHVNKHIN